MILPSSDLHRHEARAILALFRLLLEDVVQPVQVDRGLLEIVPQGRAA